MVRLAVVFAVVLSSFAAAAPQDRAGCTDPKLFPDRMPGYRIDVCDDKEFDAFEFPVSDKQRERQEGRLIKMLYRVVDFSKKPAALAVVRNYEAAVQKAGGSVVWTAANRFTGKATVDGREVWVNVQAGGDSYALTILEKKAMTQYIVLDAKALGDDLTTKGHVAVYGISFDTGKSVVKPESKPALDQVSALLKNDATLKLYVVGHTDMVGTLEDNMRLSSARAAAVVQELVKAYGVAANRLEPHGVGPLVPVATNAAEDGRAKNRRVELVKKL